MDVLVLLFAPALGLLAVGVTLLVRRDGGTASRVTGLAAFALMLGYVVAFAVWYDRDCWDVGTPSGCETAEPLLTGTWIAGVAVCLIAATVALVRWISRRARHHGPSAL